MRAMPRADRGPNARKAISVLLTDAEKAEIQKALDTENLERAQDVVGLGSKLRELGLLWARSRPAAKPKKVR